MHDGMDRNQRAFLARSYELKSLADYETGYEHSLSDDQAAKAIMQAGEFVSAVARLIEAPPGGSPT